MHACAVEWGDEERLAYERLEEEGQETLEGAHAQDTMTVLQLLHRLRRFCNHPELAGVTDVLGHPVVGPADGPEGGKWAEHQDQQPAVGSLENIWRSLQGWLGLASGPEEGAASRGWVPRIQPTQGTCAQCAGEQHMCATLACGHLICSACCTAQARASPSQPNRSRKLVVNAHLC